jgi:hypothetical protein
MASLKALSKVLDAHGVDHIVVAAPTAQTEGRERFGKLVVKTDRYGAASSIWLGFLKKFGILPTPSVLQGVHAGAFRYQYCNKAKSICIWTQERPDQNPNNPGLAGIAVLRVDASSHVPFGKIRSALRSISNISPTRKRMTKDELHKLSSQLHAQNRPLDISDIDAELEDHDSALDSLEDSSFDNFEDFFNSYKAKRNTHART